MTQQFNPITGQMENVDPYGMFSNSYANNISSGLNTGNNLLTSNGINLDTNSLDFGSDTGSSIWDNAFGKNGWGNTAVAGINSLANSWLGFENLGVAKDQYNLQKDQYNYNKSNYDAALARKADALANSF